MSKLKKIWLISLIVKLALSAIIPLSSDEAYYWVWSKNLQLSYFDHPPMVAWLLKAGEFLEPLGHAVRWPSVLLGHLTLLVWVLILKPFLSEQKISWWMYACLFSPLIGFGSIIVTPDLPVVFFWSLSLLFALRWMEKPSHSTAFLLGASLGLGFCSKYHIVILALLLVAYALWKSWRSRKIVFLNEPSLLTVIVSGLIFSTPVLLWNQQNHWISFKFQLDHGLGKSAWDPFWTYTYVLGQILMFTPIFFFMALRGRLPQSKFFITFSAWGSLAFFLLSSLKGKVEMNWPIVAYHALAVLAVIGMRTSRPLKIVNAFWGILVTVALINLWHPFISHAPDKLEEPVQFKPLLVAAKKYEPLYASSYQMASYLWYRLKRPVYKLRSLSRHDFFDDIPGSLPTENTFYVFVERDVPLPDWVYAKSYKAEILELIEDSFVVYKVAR